MGILVTNNDIQSKNNYLNINDDGTTFAVILQSPGSKVIDVIKTIREVKGIGLKEAKMNDMAKEAFKGKTIGLQKMYRHSLGKKPLLYLVTFSQSLYYQSFRRDLNPRPLPYQGNALPTELRKHVLYPVR